MLNFPDVTACGTDTETSLPCMFSAVGRRDYDERRIHGQESMLHVLAHAGFKVQWRDNQSGCKGVCAGLDEQRLGGMNTPTLCADGRCLDEILLQGLDRVVDDAHGNRFIVLHQLGSHGPAYASRYPQAFGRFQPACASGELRQCSQAEIVNAYDNSLLYTDHFLAGTIRFLQGEASRYDTAMLYVSDHGESLGEYNLYLHGLPWSIAPREQKQVPMLMWLSSGYLRDFDMELSCPAPADGKAFQSRPPLPYRARLAGRAHPSLRRLAGHRPALSKERQFHAARRSAGPFPELRHPLRLHASAPDRRRQDDWRGHATRPFRSRLRRRLVT